MQGLDRLAFLRAIRKLEDIEKGKASYQFVKCQDCEADPEIACKCDANAVCLECGAVLCGAHMVKHFEGHCIALTLDYCRRV